MIIRGLPTTVYVYAYDLDTGLGVAGDAANITGWLSADGAAAADVGQPSAVAGLPDGYYAFQLDGEQADARTLLLAALSDTPGCVIDPVELHTEGGLLRRLHALAWGNPHVIDGASPAVRTVRNEDDTADLLTLTHAVAGTVARITPSPAAAP
ncbi:MAG TPA: hypothetical protein PKC49_05405 [Phycisphaerae bacterium]|nr:hypothetical protein [Phycisphaerae bacterium]